MNRSADPPSRAIELRRIDGAEALVPDIATYTRTWLCRTDDCYYEAELTIQQAGMSEPQTLMRFEFVGPGGLDPHNARAGMNMRVGRAGLRVVDLILHPIDRMAYDAHGPSREGI